MIKRVVDLEEQKEKRIGNYKYSNDGVLYHTVVTEDKTGNCCEVSEPVSNHVPVMVRHVVTDDGTEVQEQAIFKTLRNGRYSHEIPLTMKDILSCTPNQKFGVENRIFQGKGLKALYSDFLQLQAEYLETEYQYRHTGWLDTEEHGLVYLNSGYSVCSEGLIDTYTVSLESKLAGYGFFGGSDPDRWETFKKLFEVAPKQVIYPLLSFTFLSPLNRILRELSHEPKFVLFLVGGTGTRKTSISMLFGSFFGRFDSPAENFKCTVNALEKEMSIIDGAVLLVDDRHPAATVREQTRLEEVESAIMRAIGDRVGKSRMNADRSLSKAYRPNCNCLVTGETAFDGLAESSAARAIACRIRPGEMNLPVLTDLQANRIHLNQVMTEFIQFIINHYDELKQSMEKDFLRLRAAAAEGGKNHGRLDESIADLQLGMIVLCDFLVGSGVITAAEAEFLKTDAWDVFNTLVEMQEKVVEQQNPVNQFIQAVQSMLSDGRLKIAPDKNTENSYYTGFETATEYCMIPDLLYRDVLKHFTEQGINYTMKREPLIEELKQRGYLSTGSGGSATKQVRWGKKRLYVLCLRKDKIDLSGDLEEI